MALGVSAFGVATTLRVFGPLAEVLIVFEAGALGGSGGNAEDSIAGLVADAAAFAEVGCSFTGLGVGTVILRIPGVDFFVVAGLVAAAEGAAAGVAAGVSFGVEAEAGFLAAAFAVIAFRADGMLTSLAFAFAFSLPSVGKSSSGFAACVTIF